MLFCDFLEKNTGTWVTQRTIYLVKEDKTRVHKSRILIGSNTQTGAINPEGEEGISYYVQDMTSKHSKSALKSTSGYGENMDNAMKLIRQISSEIIIYMNKLNYASVLHSAGRLSSSEKIWLINPNLRMSFSIIKKSNRCVAISFSSDIRIE
uniref:Chromophore lyase n=1 Tax=Rhodochorton tenue TaxID=173034 RepID=UPI002A7EFB14|nr:Chromophore lyase [Rhodochorton tenue]WOK79523.1 Chromophore lyase [Rhodochorton tenue]